MEKSRLRPVGNPVTGCGCEQRLLPVLWRRGIGGTGLIRRPPHPLGSRGEGRYADRACQPSCAVGGPCRYRPRQWTPPFVGGNPTSHERERVRRAVRTPIKSVELLAVQAQSRLVQMHWNSLPERGRDASHSGGGSAIAETEDRRQRATVALRLRRRPADKRCAGEVQDMRATRTDGLRVRAAMVCNVDK